ncbi:MAG TPA: SDR family oxidoreductase [Dehalococcoidia bacterium]|nr:SDR family oxidoreductase [Dehalococcoidia bacterium]
MDLNGRRAIVLGGTSGIGLAAVRQLLAAGAKVTGGSRSPEHIAAAEQAAPGAQFVQIDTLDRGALESLFAAHHGFDVLVNAATPRDRAWGPFLDMDLDAFQNTFRKLWGYTNSVRLGVPHLAPDGAIVLVSGFPARKTTPGSSAIAAVGAAIETFARGVATEIKPRRINVVSPGMIDTPMVGGDGEARVQQMARMTANNLIPRIGTADEVADAILFLIRNDFVTGTTVDVDGGALLP